MSYIPTRDADALIWMQAFSAGLTNHTAALFLNSTDATAVANAVAEFAAALAVASNNETRTPGNVEIKDTKRNLAEALCRQYAIGIKYNSGIDNNLKIDIGVRPVNESKTPIFCPQTSPLINVVAATPGAHTLKFADSLEPNMRRRPFGAAALQIFCYIGPEPTVDEDQAQFIGLYTKNPVVVAFTPEDDGQCASYFCRWSGKRGDVGPWSLPVSMRIAA